MSSASDTFCILCVCPSFSLGRVHWDSYPLDALFNRQCHQSVWTLLSLMLRLEDPSRHSEHLSEIWQEHLPGRGGRLITGRKGNTQGAQASGRCVPTHFDFQRAQKLSSSSPCVSCVSNSVSSFETNLGFEISSLYLSIIWICVCLCGPMHICVCSCVCVWTWMYLCACACLPLCICVWTCVHMCTHMSACVYVYTCLYVCTHLCLYICMHTYVLMCMCVHICVCLCVCMYSHPFKFVYMCMCAHVCACMCTYWCMLIHMCLYEYMCVHICVYVFLCLCVCCRMVSPGMTYLSLSWAAGSSDYTHDTALDWVP